MAIIYGSDDYTWSFNNNYVPSKPEFNLATSSEYFSLYNNLKNSKSKLIVFSDFSNFDNSEKTDLQSIIGNDSRNLFFCEPFNFTNLISTNTSIPASKVHFSTGLFPYYENINLLLEPSTYADLDAVIENRNVEGYWFDSSIPSRNVILQTKVISLGVAENNVQFSLRFPIYPISFEYTVGNINTDYYNNLEFKIFPLTPDVDNLNFGFDTVFAKDTLNWEWSPGEELKVSSNFEFGKTPDTISLMNYQYAYMFIEDRKLNIEYKNVINENSPINFEHDLSEISYFHKLGYEFYYGMQDLAPLNLETSTEYSGHFNYQTLVFAGTKRNLDFEFVPSEEGTETIELEYKNIYVDTYSVDLESYTEIEKDYPLQTEFFIDKIDRKLDFEYKNIYLDLYNIDIETNIDNISKLYDLNVEYNAETIWKDYITDFEFKNVYISDENIQLESNVTDIKTQIPLNFESLVFAETNYNMNFEVLRFQEKTVNVQSYVIPVIYKDTVIQINIRAFLREDLNFEVNVPELPGSTPINLESYTEIKTDYNLNLEASIPELWKLYKTELEINVENINSEVNTDFEYKHVYIDSDNIDFESKTVINSDTNLNIESYTEIDKSYELALQYVATLPYDIGMDFESKTEIETDIQLQLEYDIDALKKDYGLNLESYIEINKDYAFNFEAFVNEVSKHLHFEYDVLDLVYYVISKGYNILPWCYSDGTGFWDINSNKNWNKTEDITNIQTGLLNQLQEKGLTIPELIQYSDKNLDSFGIFIPGKSKNINIQDNLLYFEAQEDFTLVLGKRKKENISVVNLKKGNNLIIYDGSYQATNVPTFDIIRNQILNEYNYCSIWKQDEGIWKTIIGDKNHDLYFIKNIDSQDQPIPYVLMINVSADCSFEITR